MLYFSRFYLLLMVCGVSANLVRKMTNFVCLNSIADLVPFVAMPSYTTAKNGVVGMTKVLGVRYCIY